MNLSNQIHPIEQSQSDLHCRYCGLFVAPGQLSDSGLCAVCKSLGADYEEEDEYTDAEILDALINWRQYQKPQMKRIEKPRRPRRKEQRWGRRRNWGHGRRG